MTEHRKLIALCKSAIEEVDLQLERRRSIAVTIPHLEGFCTEAQEQDPSDQTWNERFHQLWETLEVTYAVAVADEQEWFESEDIDRIDDALLEMRRMLEDKISRLKAASEGAGDDFIEQA